MDHFAPKEKTLALGLVKHCPNFIICSRTILSAGSPGQFQRAMMHQQCLTKNQSGDETQQVQPYLSKLQEVGEQTMLFKRIWGSSSRNLCWLLFHLVKNFTLSILILPGCYTSGFFSVYIDDLQKQKCVKQCKEDIEEAISSVGSFLKQSPDKRLHGKGVSMLQITESRISDKYTETPEVKDNQCKTTREEIIKSIYLKKRDKKITSSSACDCF